MVGAGVAGLGSALALGRRGHRVTVVERDAVPAAHSPDEAFDSWRRRGAPQTRHSHAFLARLRNLLRDRFPDVLDQLLEAGAAEIDFTRHPPPALFPLEPEPGDEDLLGLACRRTTFEWVLRRAALAVPGVKVVPGEATGLVAADVPAGAPPHAAGVALAGGAVLRADAVVDAGGRRSPLPRWLSDLGADPVPESVEDTGIVYSSQFYRVVDGDFDAAAHGLVVGDMGYLKYAVFPGDNGTLSVTFAVHSDDAEMRRLLRPGPFSAVAAAVPAVRPWVEGGRCRPISDVEVMGGLINRRRRFAVAGRPLATGVYAVGDSSICTNPLYGRGCALAMVHAELLADALDSSHDRVETALAFADATRSGIEPWYGAAVAQDGHDRRAARAEEDDDDESGGVGVGSLMRHGLLPAAGSDPLVWRAFIRSFNLLDLPDAIMRDPAVVMRVMATWQERGNRPPPPRLGPDRGELLQLLAGAA